MPVRLERAHPKSSTKETNSITPAENPKVRLMNLGPGFLIKTPKRLPMEVAKPANVVKSSALPTLFISIKIGMQRLEKHRHQENWYCPGSGNRVEKNLKLFLIIFHNLMLLLEKV